MKKLGIIIVTYQSERYIAPLLRSLDATVDRAETVVVIWDNSSTDATLAVLGKERATLGLDLRVMASKENAGFMRGNNQAFAALQKETPCEVIALLNPDTVAHEGWWQPLVKALENPQVGTAASLLLLPDGTVNSCGKRASLSRFRLGAELRRDRSRSCRSSLPCFPAVARRWRSGPPTLESANARLGLCGIFWEELFLYADDTDLGWRLRLVGLENVLALESRVTHDHRFWLQPIETQVDRMFYLERNRYLLLLANYKTATLVLLLPWIVASEFALGLRLWKLYPRRFHLWRAVLKEANTDAFRSRRKKLQAGRTIPDRVILRAATGSIRHGAIPFRGLDRLLDALLRWSHALLCALVRW